VQSKNDATFSIRRDGGAIDLRVSNVPAGPAASVAAAAAAAADERNSQRANQA